MCWTLSCVTTLVMVLLVWAVIMVPWVAALSLSDQRTVMQFWAGAGLKLSCPLTEPGKQ